ncbi:MAG: HAD family hydrolase [Bacilli bacterium]|nr:HAD family hydrolase [Bacilli bacterium]
MENIKCIFLDIDGTVDNKKRITPPFTREILGRLKEKDILAVICSGRMTSYAVNKSFKANCSNYVIADNGSVVYDYLNKKVIFESVFPKELCSTIGEICKESKVECLFNIIDGCYRYGDYNYHKFKRGRKTTNIKKIKENITQIIISSIFIEDMIKVRDAILELGNVQVSNTNMGKDLLLGKAYYCDLNIVGNSKGKAVLELIKYLNIKQEETMCFGDSMNDLSMFNACHYKVAMKNASDELKSIADYITEDDNNNDGVGKFIEKNIL